MAVFLRDSGDPRFWNGFRLVLCDEADAARIQAGKDWLRGEEWESLGKTRDGFLIEFRSTERPWRAEFLPKKLPDYVHSYPGGNNTYASSCLVGLRLKARIEEHRATGDGWQVFPVEILNTYGTTYGT